MDSRLCRSAPQASVSAVARGRLHGLTIGAGHDVAGQRDRHLERYFYAGAVVKRRTTCGVVGDPEGTARRRKGDTPRVLQHLVLELGFTSQIGDERGHHIAIRRAARVLVGGRTAVAPITVIAAIAAGTRIRVMPFMVVLPLSGRAAPTSTAVEAIDNSGQGTMMRETASQFGGASLQRVTIQDNAGISMTIEFYSAGNDERCGPRRFRIAVSMAFASSQIEPATVLGLSLTRKCASPKKRSECDALRGRYDGSHFRMGSPIRGIGARTLIAACQGFADVNKNMVAVTGTAT